MTHLGNTKIVIELKCDQIFGAMTKWPFKCYITEGYTFYEYFKHKHVQLVQLVEMNLNF